MQLKTQPFGTPLTDEERKQLSALLVKMGYPVQMKREKSTGRGTYQYTFILGGENT